MLKEILEALKADPVDEETIEPVLCGPSFDDLLKGDIEKFFAFFPYLEKIKQLKKPTNSDKYNDALDMFFIFLKNVALFNNIPFGQSELTNHNFKQTPNFIDLSNTQEPALFPFSPNIYEISNNSQKTKEKRNPREKNTNATINNISVNNAIDVVHPKLSLASKKRRANSTSTSTSEKSIQHSTGSHAMAENFIIIDADPTPQPETSKHQQKTKSTAKQGRKRETSKQGRKRDTAKQGRKSELLEISSHLNDAGYEGEFKKYLTQNTFSSWQPNFVDVVRTYPTEKWLKLIKWFLMKKNDNVLRQVFDVQKYLEGNTQHKIKAIESIFRSKCDAAINPMMAHTIDNQNILPWLIDVASTFQQKFEHIKIVLSCRKNTIINKLLDFKIEGNDLLTWFIEHPQADKSAHIEAILCCNCSIGIRKILGMHNIFIDYLFNDKAKMGHRLHKIFSANLTVAQTIDRLKTLILKALDENKISLSDFHNLFEYPYDNHKVTAQTLKEAIQVVLDAKQTAKNCDRNNDDKTIETTVTAQQSVTTLDGLEFFIPVEADPAGLENNSYILPPLLDEFFFDLQSSAQNATPTVDSVAQNDFILFDTPAALVNSENNEAPISTSRTMRNSGNNRSQRFMPYNVTMTSDDPNGNPPPSVNTFSLFNTATTSTNAYPDLDGTNNNNTLTRLGS